MKTGDLERQFGVSGTTIRRWIETFSDFLSDEANKVDARQRRFTSDDFTVLATINSLSKDGFPFNHIKEKLAEGYRMDDPSAATAGYSDGRMVPAAAVEQIIDASELRVELEQVKSERDKLVELLEQKDKREIDLTEQKNKREAELNEKIESLQKQIADLQRELGRAEGRLEEMDKPKRRSWFGSGD